MKFQLILLPFLLFLEVLSLGLYFKVLLRLVVLFKSFLMILMMVQLLQLDLLYQASIKGIKESACWEATQDIFIFSFSGLDACNYCSNIIVYLFSSFVPSFSL